MILPLLRTGRRNKSTNIFGILRRLIGIMRSHWKKTCFIVRGDAHFCSKEFMDWATDVDYVNFVFGLTGNSALNRMVEQWVEKAERGYEKHAEEIRIFHRLTYRAGSWVHAQRVIVKIEVNHRGTNVHLFMHAAAYVLLHALKNEVFKGTCLYNVSILTLQQKILSGAVHVKTMKTKIKVEFSDKHPFRAELSLAFRRFALWKDSA